jgi:hypothetical protein
MLSERSAPAIKGSSTIRSEEYHHGSQSAPLVSDKTRRKRKLDG